MVTGREERNYRTSFGRGSLGKGELTTSTTTKLVESMKDLSHHIYTLN